MTVSCVLAGVAAAVLAIVVLDVTGALNAYAALVGAVAMAGGGLLALTADRASSTKQQPGLDRVSSDQVSV